MSFIPICLRIDDKPVVVIGGGKVALHKMKAILLYTQNIKIVAPQISDDLKKLNLTFIHESYRRELIEGCALVYAATNDREVNSQIRSDANLMNIPVNVADMPDESDFVSPALFKHGHLSVAVSSDAKDVKGAVALRAELQEYLKDSTELTEV